jgi:hypothetical protein
MDRGKLAALLGYTGSYRILYGNIYGVGGEFSQDVLDEMRKIGISPEMYDKLTDTKCRAALSNMLDIFNAPTDHTKSIGPAHTCGKTLGCRVGDLCVFD